MRKNCYPLSLIAAGLRTNFMFFIEFIVLPGIKGAKILCRGGLQFAEIMLFCNKLFTYKKFIVQLRKVYGLI